MSEEKIVEVMARVLCKERGRDPDELEPGDEPQVDGTCRNGDPGHFKWREYIYTARAALEALRREGFTVLRKNAADALERYDEDGHPDEGYGIAKMKDGNFVRIEDVWAMIEAGESRK